MCVIWVIVTTGFEWLPKVQKITQSGQTGAEQSCLSVAKESYCYISDSYCLQLDSQQPRFFKFTPHKVITCS